MSHISKSKIGIKVMESTFDILKSCAEELGAKVLDTMTVKGYGYENVTIEKGFVVNYKGVQIGVTEEKGQLTLVGDQYQHNSQWESFEQKLPMKFKEKATVIALKKLGFKTKVEQKGKELIVVGC